MKTETLNFKTEREDDVLSARVGGRIDGYYDRPWRDGEMRSSRLVVIGLKGFDQAAVEAALKV